MNGASPLDHAFVQLGVTTRNGHDESMHFGAVVGLARDGSIEFALGNPETVIFPRSSTKPIQATAMVASGLDLPPRLLALVCGSHDGSPMHLAAAREILAIAGLNDDDLGNTKDFPLDDAAAADVLRGGGIKTKLQMNCSGKHSGMLATCVHNGWSHNFSSINESYLHESHPLQQRITEMVPELSGEAAAFIGVDGCGAPAHAMSLVGLARVFRAVVMSDSNSAAGKVSDAMRSHPEMVGGPTRDVTLLMQGVPGLLAKDGAEGVFAVAMPDGRAVAIKIADGANRARPPMMKFALSALQIDIAGVDPRAFDSTIFGHGKPVGSVRITATL
ncbi:MAG: asparaginase [Actinobacteria bacterium]|nr:MAG: asparaginase [Actinomycetota bacterium]